MSRRFGFVLLLLLALAIAGMRAFESWRAVHIVGNEQTTREVLATLYHALLPVIDDHERLTGEMLAAAPQLEVLEDVGETESITYARDDAYIYGLAQRTVRKDGKMIKGFVLRAWPRTFGVSGDLEFHLTEEGTLLESQNPRGNSGTLHGFPPAFPDPQLGEDDGPWVEVPLPGSVHR